MREFRAPIRTQRLFQKRFVRMTFDIDVSILAIKLYRCNNVYILVLSVAASVHTKQRGTQYYMDILTSPRMVRPNCFDDLQIFTW
jgi:hypothetical protein